MGCSRPGGCAPEPVPEFNYRGINIYCVKYSVVEDKIVKEQSISYCPSEAALDEEYRKNEKMWDDHLKSVGHDKSFHEIVERYEIAFFEGLVSLPYNSQGLTSHIGKSIRLVRKDCPPKEAGLCRGLFDWEIGLPVVENLFPHSSEGEKLEYRKKHDLISPKETE